MLISQISVFVENKPGCLSEITNVLATNGIDIRALSLADTTHFGILRLIVNDPQKAFQVLKGAHFTVSTTQVIAVRVNDTPGGLNSVLQSLVPEKLSVEYAYAFITPKKDSAFLILRIENAERALQTFEKLGIKTVDAEELYGM